MPILSCADRVGKADGRDDLFQESIYLLDESYTVVGLRRATEPDAPTPCIGDRFFDSFPASRAELGALARMQASVSEESFLMRAGGRPVLMLCRFFARTRLLVAIVPQGDVRTCLERPAAFADLLETLYVRLSGEACVPGEPLDGDSYALLSKWLSRIHLPLFFEGYQAGRLDTEVATVAARLSYLALLCGCRLDYDLTGIGYEPFDADDLDLLIGTAFAVFLMAHRITQDRSVMILSDRLYTDGPILYALLDCDTTIDALSEIEVLRRDAVARDDLFNVSLHSNTAFPLRLQFSFCNKEISVQGVKPSKPGYHDLKPMWPCYDVDESALQ